MPHPCPTTNQMDLSPFPLFPLFYQLLFLLFSIFSASFTHLFCQMPFFLFSQPHLYWQNHLELRQNSERQNFHPSSTPHQPDTLENALRVLRAFKLSSTQRIFHPCYVPPTTLGFSFSWPFFLYFLPFYVTNLCKPLKYFFDEIIRNIQNKSLRVTKI